MPLHQCLRLLLLLETGTSGKDDVQANADQLFRRGAERLSMLLKEKAAVMAANAALQAELAEFFGRWHAMLNCNMRRQVWQCLPFEVLSVRLPAACAAYCFGVGAQRSSLLLCATHNSHY